MYHLMTCGDAPNCTWTDWLCQPLPVSTVPNTGWNLSNSTYRGLDEEEERSHCPRLWECYLHAIYRELLSLLYSTQDASDTKTLFCRQFGNIHFDSLSC